MTAINSRAPIAVIAYGSIVNHLRSDNYGGDSLKVKRPKVDQLQSSNTAQRQAIRDTDESQIFIPIANMTLPIKMSRESSRNDSTKRRITQVCKANGSQQQVFFAIADSGNLNAVIKNLRQREGTVAKNIGYVNRSNGRSRSYVPEVKSKVKAWAEKCGFKAVVWTDIPSNLNLSDADLLKMLSKDSGLRSRTKDYVKDLPQAHKTDLQKKILALTA